MTTARGFRWGEALLALGVLLLGLFIGTETALLPTGPGYSAIGPRLFPWLLTAGLMLVGLSLLREARSGAVAHQTGFELDVPPLLMISGGLVAQMLLMRPVGFVIASTVLFVAVASAFGSRRLVRNVAIGLILCVVVDLVFTRGLGLTLPAGVLGGLL